MRHLPLTLSERDDGNASVSGSNNTSTVTIWDDDTLPNLTIANAEAEEGEAIVFMPTLDIDAVNDVEITYSTSPAGAFPVEAGDYSPESGQTITIQRGETTPTPPATISISTTEDPDSEPNETFKLTYSATNVESPVADDSAIGTIFSDDPQVIAINDVTVNEDARTATLNVSVSPAPATNPVEVSFAINTDSTTTADSGDYTLSTATPSPLNFGVGESSKQITFNITDDVLAEDSETITVTLTNTANIAYYGGDSTGTVTITDNDALPALELVALTENIMEGTDTSDNNIDDNTTQNVTVRLTGGATAGRNITATYTLAGDGTNEVKIPYDIKLASTAPGRTSDTTGTVTIADGQQSATIPLEIIADANDEFNENFKITLSNEVNTTLGTDEITGIIEDDDDQPVARIGSGLILNERYGDNVDHEIGGLRVILAQASGKTVKVNYASVGIDATLGEDITGHSGTVTFNPDLVTGLTPRSMLIPFSIVADDIVEETEEFVMGIIQHPDGNATVPRNSPSLTLATLAIIDSASVTVSIAGAGAVNEGEDAVFTVSTDESDNSRTTPLVINLTTSSTGTNFISGTPRPSVTIPAGSTFRTYRVATTNDNVAGDIPGLVTVTINNGVGYRFGGPSARASVGVRDNAGVRGPEAYISDAAATAEGTEMVFTVRLSRRPSLNTNVYYTIHSDSTAVAGEDFTQPALNYVTFQRGSRFPVRRPGEITKQIRIPLIHDNYDESDETIVIELTRANNNYNIDTFGNRAIGTITDHANDVVIVSVEDAAGLEGQRGNNNIPVTLRLNIPSSRDIEVDWVTSIATGGTNNAAADDFVVESSSRCW